MWERLRLNHDLDLNPWCFHDYFWPTRTDNQARSIVAVSEDGAHKLFKPLHGGLAAWTLSSSAKQNKGGSQRVKNRIIRRREWDGLRRKEDRRVYKRLTRGRRESYAAANKPNFPPTKDRWTTLYSMSFRFQAMKTITACTPDGECLSKGVCWDCSLVCTLKVVHAEFLSTIRQHGEPPPTLTHTSTQTRTSLCPHDAVHEHLSASLCIQKSSRAAFVWATIFTLSPPVAKLILFQV